MNEHSVMGELHELLSSGRTQAAVNLIEAEMRVARNLERGAAAHLESLRTLIDGPEHLVLIPSTITDMADWIKRMRTFDEPEFVDELVTLLEYGRSRASCSGTDGAELVRRFTRVILKVMPADDPVEDDDVQN